MTDQANFWNNSGKGNYDALDSTTVIIDALEAPDKWVTTPAFVNNSNQY